MVSCKGCLISKATPRKYFSGQYSFNPETRVMACAEGPMPYAQAEQWAMMACCAGGRPWWYGYAPIAMHNTATGKVSVVEGWWLVPRDPEELRTVCDA